jgi:uncharacterized membrane protein
MILKTTTPEEKEKENAKASFYPWRWLSGILILFALYILGFGPVILMYKKGIISQQTALTLYLPIDSICNAVPPLSNFVDWYMKFWKV